MWKRVNIVSQNTAFSISVPANMLQILSAACLLCAKQYPEMCGKFVVKSVRDLTTGYDSSQPDGKAVS